MSCLLCGLAAVRTLLSVDCLDAEVLHDVFKHVPDPGGVVGPGTPEDEEARRTKRELLGLQAAFRFPFIMLNLSIFLSLLGAPTR